MNLITTYWGDNKTFKMMPIARDCPYLEVIYDPTTDLLVVMTTGRKDKLEMLPRIDDDGNQIAAKKPKQNGKPWKEIRIRMTVPQEFWLTERDEQIAFIEMFAANADMFDYDKFFKNDKEKALYTPEAQPLVDDKGAAIAPLKKKKTPALTLDKK